MSKHTSHNNLFDPKNIESLEAQERKTLQDPEKIIKLLGFKDSDIVADLGCGTGYFSVPISHQVRKVYAIDIQEEMLDYLTQKIRNQQITNIELILSSDANKIPLPNESVNFLLTVMTIHEFHDKEKMANEIHRVLKPKGKAAIIDFKKENTGFGPPLSIRISQEQTIRLFEKIGLKSGRTYDLKLYYLVIVHK